MNNVNYNELVGRGLDVLRSGLAPYVTEKLKEHYGDSWWTRAVEPSLAPRVRDRLRPEARSSEDRFAALDLYDLLKIVWKNWNDVFARELGRPGRTYVSELQETRDRHAHPTRLNAFSQADADRALDTMNRLLELIFSPNSSEPVRLRELTRQRFETRSHHDLPQPQPATTELSNKIRNHAKLNRAGSPTLEAFIKLAEQLLAAYPDRIEIGATRQFVPFSLVRAGRDRNFADVIEVRKDKIDLALKTCEPDYRLSDPERKTRPLRSGGQAWRFSGYQREITLRSQTDVPYVQDIVLQCFRNFSARHGGRMTSGPTSPAADPSEESNRSAENERRAEPDSILSQSENPLGIRDGSGSEGGKERKQRTEVVTDPRAPAVIGFVAFVRGMAMFANRRVKKQVQENLLRRYLPADIRFFGAFDKSGNYALASSRSAAQVGSAILEAVGRHEKLTRLQEIVVARAVEARGALEALVAELKRDYGELFDSKTFGVTINEDVWRAGLSFLPKQRPGVLSPFSWPGGPTPKVKVLGSNGSIVSFLKREERIGANRISFGDPTRIVDAVLAEQSAHLRASTSRSARTVQGVLRHLERGGINV